MKVFTSHDIFKLKSLCYRHSVECGYQASGNGPWWPKLPTFSHRFNKLTKEDIVIEAGWKWCCRPQPKTIREVRKPNTTNRKPLCRMYRKIYYRLPAEPSRPLGLGLGNELWSLGKHRDSVCLTESWSPCWIHSLGLAQVSKQWPTCPIPTSLSKELWQSPWVTVYRTQLPIG